jgi:hypothetical protein
VPKVFGTSLDKYNKGGDSAVVRRPRPAPTDRRSAESSRPVCCGAERKAPGGLRGASGCGAWGGAHLGRRVVSGGVRCGRARRRGAVAPWPGRVVGPLFERVFLHKFVLKCIK